MSEACSPLATWPGAIGFLGFLAFMLTPVVFLMLPSLVQRIYAATHPKTEDRHDGR